MFDLEFPLGFEFDWHRDYRYGRQVERRFAGALNIRDTAVVSDIKYVWEPSRHQHLSALAFAANGKEHADYIVRSIDSWLHANPYLHGVHWTSSLELAERIISWALLYPRIADQVASDEDFRRRWLDSIYLHLTRIAGKLSLYSSANNHLLGELVGLVCGVVLLRLLAGMQRLAQSRAEIAGARNSSPGWGRRGESRTGDVVSPVHDGAFPARLRHRPQHWIAVQCGICGAVARHGRLPRCGGHVERRSAVVWRFRRCARVRGIGRRQPAGSDHAIGWAAFCCAALVALPHYGYGGSASAGSGPARKSRPHVPSTPPATPRELFPDAGLACVRTHDGSVRLLMDFGPLGFGSTAAHGHADALSLWLSIDDEYFLVDAGTYAYHSHPEWRTFFRSTAAHNTACMDGRNQSEMAGRFLWSSKANARLLRFEDSSGQVTIEAEHDGYLHLPDPVSHRRTVGFDRATGNISIEDSFRCTGRHEVELFFHMHEDADVVRVSDGEAEVAWRQRRIVFSSPDRNASWEIFKGSENPKLGWRSRRFNQKQPIATLRIRVEIDGSNYNSHSSEGQFMNISIVGLGYVGTVSAACLAGAGHHVWGVDINADKVRIIDEGRSPIVENGLAEKIAQGRQDWIAARHRRHRRGIA